VVGAGLAGDRGDADGPGGRLRRVIVARYVVFGARLAGHRGDADGTLAADLDGQLVRSGGAVRPDLDGQLEQRAARAGGSRAARVDVVGLGLAERVQGVRDRRVRAVRGDRRLRA